MATSYIPIQERRTRLTRLAEIWDSYGPFLTLAGLMIIVGTVSPYFYRPGNVLNVLQKVSALGIVSIGQTIVILGGGIDLSVASVMALSNVVSASLIHGRNTMVVPVSLACIAGGLLIGTLNGLIVTRRRVPPFIVTLGMAAVLQGIRFVYTKGAPFGEVPSWLRFVGVGRIGSLPVSLLILGALAVVSSLVLRKTVYGRYLYYIGDSPTAARLSGIDVDRVTVSTYAVSGAVSALAGLVLLGYLGFADNWAGKGYDLDSIAAVVVGGTALRGGRGGIGGTICGVLIIAILFNFVHILGLSIEGQLVVQAVVVLVSVALYSMVRRPDDQWA